MQKKLPYIFYIPLVFFLVTMAACKTSEPAGNRSAAPDTTAADTAAADTTGKEEKNAYEKILDEAAKSAAGLLNIYYKDQKLYLEVPFDLMGRDMLLSSTISEISDNKLGTVGAKPHPPLQIQFTRVDSVLLLQEIHKDAIAPEENPGIHEALAKNSIGSVIEKFDIHAFNDDKTAAVIDATDFFVSDAEKLSPFGPVGMNVPSAMIGQKSFKKDRSFIGNFKSFEDNLTVKSHLSYEYSLTEGGGGDNEETLHPFTAAMTRTLILLPEDPMRPRIGDPRLGIFTTRKNRYSTSADKVEAVRYARRFRLEPDNVQAYKKGKLVEPVRPITFYVDTDFPESWRQTIKSGITDWNSVFEKIGFKNAIRALDYPEGDPEFDPDNLKYNVVRYAPTPVQNAMGPSWIDPGTGEILNASVYIYHDVVRLINNWRFIQTAPADTAARHARLPESYKREGLRYVVRHEIGHTLGFMHNMAGSYAIPVDSLRSPAFTQKYGTTHSIMDYARFNYVARPGDKARGVKLTPPKFGLYDYYLVEWNYRYFPEEVSKEKQREMLTQMVDEKAGDERYRYGAQGSYLDPSSLPEDLGGNAVRASEYGIANLKYITSHLNEWVGDEDRDYSYRKSIRNGIITQYVRYLNHLYANVGGIYINKKYAGDPRPHYRSVSREKQREAFRMLLEQVKNMDWLEQEELVKNLPLTGDPVSMIQDKIIQALLRSPEKVNLSALKSREENPYGPDDVMEDMYEVIWKKPAQKATLSETERKLQKDSVRDLISKSGLRKRDKPAPAAFSHARFKGIPLPGFVKRQSIALYGRALYEKYLAPDSPGGGHTGGTVAAAYGSADIHFHSRPVLENLHYTYLKKIKSLLEETAKKAADTKTEIHYDLLLHKIETVML